jgi:hypothetical protein
MSEQVENRGQSEGTQITIMEPSASIEELEAALWVMEEFFFGGEGQEGDRSESQESGLPRGDLGRGG